VSATTTREGVALSIAIDLAIACVTTLSQPDLKSSHPVVSRAALTLLGLDVAIFITFFLNSSTNFNLATGAAMSIVLLGLSFLTGASGQISSVTVPSWASGRSPWRFGPIITRPRRSSSHS